MEQTILIADDHSIIRKGLKLYMQLNLNYCDVTEVGTCNDLMIELSKKIYTHLVLDLMLSDGNTLEIIPNIIKIYPALKIMVFSMQPEEVYGEALKQYGINNYLYKSVSEEEIIKRLENFLSDANFQSENSLKKNAFSSLTAQELEVLHYLLKGMDSKEISEIIKLKLNSINSLKNKIFEKTNTSNSKELLELATLYNVNY